MAAERLQKILAAAGYGSRRACEALVSAGRVRVNGQTAGLGDKADPAVDKIAVDGETVRAESKVYVILNKPRGVISSLEAQGDRSTVRDLVPLPGRLYPVGRLDNLSEGLVLLTNDGELTNRLTHPRYGHDKEYRVLIRGRIDPGRLEAWQRGVVIKDEDGKSERTAPAEVYVEARDRQGRGSWLRVIMREGKKHQIRRVAETLGLRVTQLIRVRIGPLRLEGVRPGEWRHLTRSEERALFEGAGLPARKRPHTTEGYKRPKPQPGGPRKDGQPKPRPRGAPPRKAAPGPRKPAARRK
jgi:23S rRNA pseudouridine2605 synthase